VLLAQGTQSEASMMRLRRGAATKPHCRARANSPMTRHRWIADLVETRSLRPVAKMERKMNIKLHAPTIVIFLISLVLAVLALVGYFVVIPYITMYGFWIAIVAYVVLAYGNVMEI